MNTDFPYKEFSMGPNFSLMLAGVRSSLDPIAD